MILPDSLNLQIGLTDRCNIDCIACALRPSPYPFHADVPRGYMSIEMFRKIMTEARANGYRYIDLQFQWFGEPLLHPEFKEILNIASDGPLSSLSLLTNAVMLDKSTRNSLFEWADKLQPVKGDHMLTLHVSVDASTAEIFKRVKRSSRFNLVEENLMAFLKERKERGLIHPRLIVQFIMMHENRFELEEFKERWENRLRAVNSKYTIVYKESELNTEGDLIFLKPLDTTVDSNSLKTGRIIPENESEPSSEDSSLPEDESPVVSCTDSESEQSIGEQSVAEQSAAEIPPGIETSCRYLWQNLTFHHSGRISPCCFDTGLTLLDLSVTDLSLKEILSSAQLSELRNMHLDGKKPDLCIRCPFVEYLRKEDQAYLLYQMNEGDISSFNLKRGIELIRYFTDSERILEALDSVDYFLEKHPCNKELLNLAFNAALRIKDNEDLYGEKIVFYGDTILNHLTEIENIRLRSHAATVLSAFFASRGDTSKALKYLEMEVVECSPAHKADLLSAEGRYKEAVKARRHAIENEIEQNEIEQKELIHLKRALALDLKACGELNESRDLMMEVVKFNGLNMDNTQNQKGISAANKDYSEYSSEQIEDMECLAHLCKATEHMKHWEVLSSLLNLNSKSESDFGQA